MLIAKTGGGLKTKKTTKAFTLIELLAIIVILAIIAVITVPIILNIIENSRKGAIVDSAYGYKDAINKFYLGKSISDDTIAPVYGIEIVKTVSQLETDGLTVSGDKPSEGWVQLNKGQVVDYSLKFGDYVVSFDSSTNTPVSTKNGELKAQPSSVPTIATCPGCKFIFTTDYYAIEGTTAENDYSSDMPTAEDGLTNDYRNMQMEFETWIADDDTEYYDEYECYEANNDTDCESGTTSVQIPYFLGLIESTTDSTKIGRAFACGIENGTPFCLEGYDTSKYSDDYNVGVLNTIFQGCNASASDTDALCYGSSVAGIADADGGVTVDVYHGDCSVNPTGFLYCYE